MDAETQAAIEQLAQRLEAVREDVARRVDWLAMHHDREWKTGAAWRSQWTAELDALEIEVGLLKMALEQHIMDEAQESQHARIVRKVRALTAMFAEVLFDLLPDDRQPLKDRFSASLGDLLAEVIGGSTVMAAGVVVSIDKRVRMLEDRAVGDGTQRSA